MLEGSEVQNQKKKEELRSKSCYKNTIYQLAAMNSISKMRLKNKLEEKIPINSRFFEVI